MVRWSLIVAALLAVSSPLAAQDEYVWRLDRPDAEAPLGVTGARTLEAGAFELSYRFTQMNNQGVWLDTDTVPIGETLQDYQVAPTSLMRQTHSVMAAWGLSESFTLMAEGEFTLFEREQYTSGGMFYRVSDAQLGDVRATGIYELYHSGPYRMNVSLGVSIPTGKARTYGQTPYSGMGEEPLPYDMRPGTGSWGVLPGISGQVQNEFGSLGAQFKGHIKVNENSLGSLGGQPGGGFKYGDTYQANGWAAYRINDVVSVSAGVRWQSWGNIDGEDPYLDKTRDPVNNPVFLGGQRADMPLGINFVVPGTGPIAGHRLSLEAVYALHHDYKGPQTGLDWGINLGWKMGF